MPDYYPVVANQGWVPATPETTFWHASREAPTESYYARCPHSFVGLPAATNLGATQGRLLQTILTGTIAALAPNEHVTAERNNM